MNQLKTMSKDFYYKEWKEAKLKGNLIYANNCKEKYRSLVIKELKTPYKTYIDKLKAYPPIYIN